MAWIEDHIEWTAGLAISGLVAIVGFFGRLAWNDRKGVIVRLTSIETMQGEHTGKIHTLEQEVREAEVEAADDRKEILALLEKQSLERRNDSEALHNRITEIFGAVKRIEGRMESRGSH